MKSEKDLKILEDSFKWIAQNKKSWNIKGVFQVGDIVDNNSDEQWKRAQKSYSILRGKVPFFFTTGNHDYGEEGGAEKRISKFSFYFQPESTANLGTYRESYSKDQLENSAYELWFGNESFLILCLEFAPRDEVVKWAKKMTQKTGAKKVILVTHEYMDMTSGLLSLDRRPQPSDRNTYGNSHHYQLKGSSKNNGMELWRKLIHASQKFEWVYSGHYDYVDGVDGKKPIFKDGRAFAYRGDLESSGNIVHQIMYNAQWIRNGGDGWMLMIEVDGHQPDVARISSFSPWISELGNRPMSEPAQKAVDFKVRRSKSN
jgi:hypothetical protein